jgi:putative hydrolase of the HAD superfamily
MGEGKPEAVIFDFGNVICNFDVFLFIEGISRKTGTTNEVLRKVMPGINKLAVAYETGQVSSDQFFERICALAGITISRDDFVHAYTGIFTPIEDSFELIRELKPHYKLGLLSNTNEWHYLHCIRPLDIFPLFDAVTLSYEVGAMKPSPATYDDMLRKLRLPAEKCAYVDDIQENVDAAAKLGLRAVRFVDPEQLRTALRQLGVLTL